MGGIGRGVGVAERREDHLHAIVEEERRLRERDDAGQEDAIGERTGRNEEGDRGDERREGRHRREGAGPAGGRNHFGGRRLSGGKGRRERIAARERRCHGERRCGPVLRGGIETAHDRPLDGRIEIADDRRWRRDLDLLASGDQLRDVPRFDRAPAGEHLVEHEAERVQVAARRDFLPRELFRRHVRGRSRTQEFARRAREAEIGDADPAGAVEHDVRRLEVAVDDAAVVRGGEARADLARQLDRAVLRKAADATEQRREILAVDVLHRQERVAFELADVVHAAHVGMRDLPRHADFRMELRQPRRIAIERLGEELQRDRLAELQIVGPIHLAHTAPTEAPDDPVAAVEDGSGRESAVIDRFR